MSPLRRYSSFEGISAPTISGRNISKARSPKAAPCSRVIGSASTTKVSLSVLPTLYDDGGREMKLVVNNADDLTAADPGLLRIIVRAHDFQERLVQDPNLTVPAIASQERLTIGYLSRLLRLPSLAPDIVTAIINGKHPPQLSAKQLTRLALKLPTNWAEQRKLLGFQER